MNRDQILRILVHALAAALLLVVPSLWLGDAVWRMQLSVILVIFMFAAAYFAAALLLIVGSPTDALPGPLRIFVHGLAGFGVAFMGLAFAEWKWPATFGAELPTIVPFTSLVLGMALLAVLLLVRGSWLVKIPVLAVALVAALALQLGLPWKQAATPTRAVAYQDTSLYVIKTTTYRNWIADANHSGGGIAALGDGYLLSGGDGRLHFVEIPADGPAPEARELAYRVPVNHADFQRGAREVLARSSRRGDVFLGLRVSDLLLQDRPGDAFRLFVSHHFWKAGEACAVVRVSVLEGARRELLASTATLDWRTLYESAPCLTLNVDGRRGVRFAALQSGGAMALLGDEELLLAIGDHEFDGWYREPMLPQDPTASYGKVMSIRLDTGQAELYSLGHRNPQGLYVDPAGTIWSTEHGPRGGDELNRIRRGANYGWPLVTYGTEYTLHSWPLNETPGRHEGFEKPMLAFVPSLAATALTGIAGKRFEAWRGDLMLASLTGELRRVRIEEGRVTLVEVIAIGSRIRDIAEGPDGRLVAWTDQNDLVVLEPAGDGTAESLVYQCTGCHTFNREEHASIGPNLNGVVDRKVASEPDFSYSPAMRDFGGRWTRERLDGFLESPEAAVPGTTMQYPGMPDAGQRRQLIDYLDRAWRKRKE